MAKTGKPVANVWYSIEACKNDILMLRESNIDPYAVGDIWLVRGRDRDLVVDTGPGRWLLLYRAPIHGRDRRGRRND